MTIDTYITRNIDIAIREGREVRMSPDAHGFTVPGVVATLRLHPAFKSVTRSKHPLCERVTMLNCDLVVVYPFGVYADDLPAL